LPAEWPVMRSQRLLNQVYRFPEAVDITNRVGVARHHLAVARFDKADLQPAARDHVRRRVFLGHPHRIGADCNQSPERKDADLLGLPRKYAKDHRARTVEAVDPGMMLDRDDVDPEVVAQQVLVEALLEEIRRNLGIAIFVGQAGAHRLRAVEDFLRHKRIDVLAMIPSLHPFSLPPTLRETPRPARQTPRAARFRDDARLLRLTQTANPGSVGYRHGHNPA